MMQETEDERIQKRSNRISPKKEGIHGDHGKENGSGCPKQLDVEQEACVQGRGQEEELRETAALQCPFVQGFSPTQAKDIKRVFSEKETYMILPNMKRCSTSFSEMQIKATLRC